MNSLISKMLSILHDFILVTEWSLDLLKLYLCVFLFIFYFKMRFTIFSLLDKSTAIVQSPRVNLKIFLCQISFYFLHNQSLTFLHSFFGIDIEMNFFLHASCDSFIFSYFGTRMFRTR